MGRRSEQGPLAALQWLDDSGLFVPPVSLRDWNELPRVMEVCARPVDEFRKQVAEHVRAHWGEDPFNNRDGAYGEAAVRHLLAQRPGCPPLVAVDLLTEDPDDAGGNTPDLLMLDFAFPGGRKLPSAEAAGRVEAWLERTATSRSRVERMMDVLAPEFPEVESRNPAIRAKAEAALEAWAGVVALAAEDARMYSGPRQGRIGYIELVPDVDWPTWKPVPAAEATLRAVRELWPTQCATNQALADTLNDRGLRTLSGEKFTKASVIKVLIAERLVAGSAPPWK